MEAFPSVLSDATRLFPVLPSTRHVVTHRPASPTTSAAHPPTWHWARRPLTVCRCCCLCARGLLAAHSLLTLERMVQTAFWHLRPRYHVRLEPSLRRLPPLDPVGKHLMLRGLAAHEVAGGGQAYCLRALARPVDWHQHQHAGAGSSSSSVAGRKRKAATQGGSSLL